MNMKTAVTSRNKLKLVEIALLVGLAAFLASGGLALRAQTQLAERVVRLHVLANSDGEEDQELKLLVRDRVLARATELLTQAGNRAEAESLLRRELPELEALAARELRANGCDYPVTAELTDTEFPTREYDGFTLPAGEYLALRVVIGEGAGRNWWCVVFPPLCTAASAEVPAAALAAGLTEDQVGLITEEDRGYVLKFKTVEWWEQLRSQLAERGFAKS
jgi:stage II sporulation protein R